MSNSKIAWGYAFAFSGRIENTFKKPNLLEAFDLSENQIEELNQKFPLVGWESLSTPKSVKRRFGNHIKQVMPALKKVSAQMRLVSHISNDEEARSEILMKFYDVPVHITPSYFLFIECRSLEEVEKVKSAVLYMMDEFDVTPFRFALNKTTGEHTFVEIHRPSAFPPDDVEDIHYQAMSDFNKMIEGWLEEDDVDEWIEDEDEEDVA